MLATIDDNGVYHDPHLITSITQNDAQTPIKITSYPVFSANPALNAERTRRSSTRCRRTPRPTAPRRWPR